jgi:hypothetical protein
MDNIINYKCRFRVRKRLNNFFPLSSELFLRWDKVGRVFMGEEGGFFLGGMGRWEVWMFLGAKARSKPLKIC